MRDQDKKLLQEAVLGNQVAERFLADVWFVVSLWDDLIDADAVRTKADVNDAFWRLFVTIPVNPFYRENFSDLFPIVKGAAMTWLASNEIDEKSPVLAKTMAMHYVNLIVACALICGGRDHAVMIAQMNWLAFFHEED